MNYTPFKISSTKSFRDSAQEIAKLLRPFIQEDYVNYTSTKVPYFIFSSNNRNVCKEICNHVSAEIFGLKFSGDPLDYHCPFVLISYQPIKPLEKKQIFESLRDKYYGK